MSDQKFEISFKEALDMGKYQEEFLSKYPEWQNADKQIRAQFINRALKNRRIQLRLQWANLANQLDFSKKPHLAEAQKKVEASLKELNEDEEKLLVKYAGC